MSVTYSVERWADYYRDCLDVWAAHYDEIAGDKDRMAMKPDLALFEQLDAQGALQIVTARRDEVLIGYVLIVVRPHPHYADVLCGFEDAYFLLPSERKGNGLGFRSQTGVQMISFALDQLKTRGVQKVFFHTKECRNVSAVLRRLGMKKCDEVLTMWLGD